jgi:sulfite reductase (NADPH) hemoprotein beta-component
VTSQIVTANRLSDGVVVYLAAGGAWSERVEQARVARAEDAAAALLAFAESAEQGIVVVGPYLMEVAAENGALRPVSNREVIRARGPTVRQDLGKQAELA